MDNLCVNVRKVNKGEKKPFTIQLFQKKQMSQNYLFYDNRLINLITFLKFKLGRTHKSKLESICHLKEPTKKTMTVV